ncbi:MAG: nucleotidyltransferase [Acidobacteriaceae bacterium]|nr:nucleotidyltransferase [Acidobacteriaceae bacterium]
MAENRHFRDLLRSFEKFGVEYLIVGGYAVMKYTEPRYTKDVDIWIGNSAENSRRVYAALAEFGAPLERDQIGPGTFTEAQLTYQIGVPPVRIDIMTSIDGVQFEQAWPNRATGTFLGASAQFLSLDDLITNKRAVGRASDQEDLKHLLTRAQDRQ